jgi:anti-sigma-K factor RskA
MNCESLRESYSLYALGVAEDAERCEISAHIARGCAVCRQQVSEALAVASALAATVKIQKPPDGLERRLIATVERKKQRPLLWSLLPWVVVALLSAIILGIALPAQRQSKDMATLDQILTIVNDPSSRVATFGDSMGTGPKGRVFLNSGKGIVFIGANLPKLDPGKAYELWILPPGGKPSPGGTFEPQGNANALYVFNGPVLATAGTEVSIEPEGGSPQPTTAPFGMTR